MTHGAPSSTEISTNVRALPASAAFAPALPVPPQGLAERHWLAGGRAVTLRPIRPEDEPAHRAFAAKLSPEDVRFRFFRPVRRLPDAEMARLTHIDYQREMAFIASRGDDGERPETLGVVRVVSDPAGARAEFAIVVRSDLKGQGLGTALMAKMIRYCRSRGMVEIFGHVLRDNGPMLALAERFGFRRTRSLGADNAVEISLALAASAPSRGARPDLGEDRRVVEPLAGLEGAALDAGLDLARPRAVDRVVAEPGGGDGAPPPAA